MEVIENVEEFILKADLPVCVMNLLPASYNPFLHNCMIDLLFLQEPFIPGIKFFTVGVFTTIRGALYHSFTVVFATFPPPPLNRISAHSDGAARHAAV